jgi:DNA polymerase alpha subunit A
MSSKKSNIRSALAALNQSKAGVKRSDQYEEQEAADAAAAPAEPVDTGEMVEDDEEYELYSDQEFDEDEEDRRNRRIMGNRGSSTLHAFMKPKKMGTEPRTTYVSTKPAQFTKDLDDLFKEFEENLDHEEVVVRPPAVVTSQVKRPIVSSTFAPSENLKKTRQDMEVVEHDHSEDIPVESLPPEEVPTTAPVSTFAPSSILDSANWGSTAADEEDEEEAIAVPVDLAEGVLEESVVPEGVPDSLAAGGMQFYLVDVHEDHANASVILFGRLRSSGTTTHSCSIIVKNINRNVFFLHRDAQEEDDDVARSNSMAVFAEFDKLRKSGKKPFADIKEFKVPKQLVRRNYSFELPGVPHGLLNFFKVVYPGKYPALPSDLTGDSFSRIFGANTSLTELLLVKCKIMGPCWLNVAGAVKQDRRARSWCKEEYTLDFGGLKSKSFKPITVVSDNVPEPPRLSILGISIKSIANTNLHREIASVAMCSAPAVKLESTENEIKFDAVNGKFTALRLQEGRGLPQREIERLRSLGIDVCDEKQLLNLFCAKIQQLDPDIIMGHNVFGNELDVLAARMTYYGIKSWHRLSRLQRPDEPNPPKSKKGGPANSQWAGRQCTIGRLVCDTYLNARELVRESNYEIGNLSKSLLGITRQVHPVPSTMVPGGDAADSDAVLRICAGNFDGMKAIAEHTLCDALLSIRIAWSLQVLPLTRQLSNLAGNLWSNSLLNKRAERNEWLLVHEFKRLKYIVPDKQAYGQKKAADTEALFDAAEPHEDDHEAGATTSIKRRKAAAYMGGLVLEPKAGLYDKLVLLLDFNSLYPSIIREYNLCFTTVQRMDGVQAEAAETPEAVIPAHPPKGLEDGVLPRVITRLVNSRKAVKQMLKTEKKEATKLFLDIRQKALKLTANSLYGCLGFSSSRFYAKPIASLITWTGRQTLQATVDLVEKNLRLDVVYGDTDSIFVHTGQDDFAAALAIGSEISKEVNKRYTKLEIELDGVFRTLLLLKKKKYAGLKVKDWEKNSFEREQKGLDMVRRDWCVMSKEMGGDILDQLLNPTRTKDETILWLEEYLRGVGTKMNNWQSEMTLEQFVITKAITKMPDEYPDAKNQPHVLVAKRRMAAGERIRPGNEIPYIVCKLDTAGEEGPALSIAERARSPDEVSRESLSPDVAWYKAQQIHPPISRLCTPTGLADSARIAEWLGLDPSRFVSIENEREGNNDDGENAGFDEKENLDVETRFKDHSFFFSTMWKCPGCKVTAGLVLAIKTPTCPKCSQQKIETPHVRNLITLAVRDIQNKALLGWSKCDGDDCGAVTRQVTVEGHGDRCPLESCVGGRLHPVKFTSREIHDHFVFLHEMCKKYRPDAADITEECLEQNAYDSIDLAELFSALAIKGA